MKFPSGVDAWMSRLEERINGSISPSYIWRLLELEPTDPNLLLSSWDIQVPTPPIQKREKNQASPEKSTGFERMN